VETTLPVPVRYLVGLLGELQLMEEDNNGGMGSRPDFSSLSSLLITILKAEYIHETQFLR
jgi:hypothetical protein